MGTSFVTVYNTQLSDAAQLNQIFTPINNLEDGKPFWGTTTTGSANAHVLATNPSTTTLAAGKLVTFKAGYSNSGAATLNVGTGLFPIILNGAALAGGEILAGAGYLAVFDGTSWHLIGGASSGTIPDMGIARAASFATPDGGTSYVASGDTGFTAWYAAGTHGGAYCPALTQAYRFYGAPSRTQPYFLVPSGVSKVRASGAFEIGMSVEIEGQVIVRIMRYQAALGFADGVPIGSASSYVDALAYQAQGGYGPGAGEWTVTTPVFDVIEGDAISCDVVQVGSPDYSQPLINSFSIEGWS